MPAQTRIIHYYVCLGAAGGKECEVIMVGAIFSVLTSITWAPYQNFLKATQLLTIINYVPNLNKN